MSSKGKFIKKINGLKKMLHMLIYMFFPVISSLALSACCYSMLMLFLADSEILKKSYLFVPK